MAIAIPPPPPRATANPAPVRPAHSVRRSSSIDVSWPDGPAASRLFIGRARDYLTPAISGVGAGATSAAVPGRTLDEAEYRAILADDKTITAITARPSPAGIDSLVGVRGGNHLRLFIRETMPELIADATPIYLVLDDISGTALVSAFAWSQWHDDWAAKMREAISPEEMARHMADRVNVCWGLQEGNSGVQPEGPTNAVADADAGELVNPLDPEGWHDLPESDGPGFRRARRIDVTRDPASGLIHIDAAFQDSAKRKDGGRTAIHEYRITATARADTLELLSLEPEARILPFSECPGAIHNTRRLVGSRLPLIRETVLAQLRGPEGCTHLNDALRCLAEVPRLAQYLDALQPA